jgi:superfamily I DNA/RNA helicase
VGVLPDFVIQLLVLSVTAALLSAATTRLSGSDIGPRVIGILRKLGPESLTQERVYEEIEGWRSEKLARQSTTAEDIANCMRVFANFGESLGQAISYAEHLFNQRGSIQLLTGHKAKGLEWPTVYHLDPWLLSETEQELNLRYVILTRAMDSYYEIDSREIRWE